jgi:putative ABC transport system permease protein
LLKKYFSIAFEALFLNKVRSLLTTLGIVIGVFSVIVMIGFGQASQGYITQEVKGLGSGVIVITPGNPKTQGFAGGGLTSAKTLTPDDAKSIENIPGVLFVTANTFIQTMMTFNKNNQFAQVIGTNSEIQFVKKFKFSHGRFYTEQEDRTGSKVIVLGAKLAKEVFKNTLVEPYGAKVKIGNKRYRVIGVLEEQGSSMLGSDDDQAFMPTKTFHDSIKGGENLTSILVKVESDSLLAMTNDRIKTLLRFRHYLRGTDEDDFKIQTQAEILETVGVITQVFTFLLAGIAAISLLVGGIGIMNIMLVSVTERTKEIGIRKAVGAKRQDILIQFLIEAGSISFFGGTIGIVSGLLTIKIITKLINLPFILSPVTIVGAFVFSATVGIFFGLYPANKASKLDPIDALRYE